MKPVLGTALFLALFTAACTTLPPDVSRAVRQSLAAMEDNARAPSSLASKVSVSPSGDDWFIDYEKTGDFGWCGTGGCTRELWVARDKGHVLAFEEQVIDWRLRPGAPAIVDIDIHGANCDAFGSEPCLRRFVWNEMSGRLEEAINREGSGYLVGPLFQPVEPEPYPEAVQAEIERRDAICHAAGGLVDGGEYPAVSSPDLNGDGGRDWIVGSKYIGCHSPTDAAAVMPELGVTVLVSAGEQWRLALTVSETAYVVELTEQGPARFGLRDEPMCLGRPGCPTRFFVWNKTKNILEDSGQGSWSPNLVVTAETWLECEEAQKRVIAFDDTEGRAGAPEAEALNRRFAVHYRQMLEEYQSHYADAMPHLSPADEADRRAVFARRYDDPDEIEPARWRSDLCVTLP